MKRTLCLLAGLAAIGCSENPPPTDFERALGPGPHTIAHRCGAGLAPENTLEACQRAVDEGAHGVEIDLHMSADGHIVVIHDETVEGTTEGSGRVADFTLAELQALDAGYDFPEHEGYPDETADDVEGNPFRGQGVVIPTLEAFFDAFPELPVALEIKQTSPSLVEPLAAMLEQRGVLDHVCIGAFDDATAQEVRARLPDVCLWFPEQQIRCTGIDSLIPIDWGDCASDYDLLWIPTESAGITYVNERFVANAHQNGWPVYTWTLNSSVELEQFFLVGVDGVVTDYPDRAAEVLSRIQPELDAAE